MQIKVLLNLGGSWPRLKHGVQEVDDDLAQRLIDANLAKAVAPPVRRRGRPPKTAVPAASSPPAEPFPIRSRETEDKSHGDQ